MDRKNQLTDRERSMVESFRLYMRAGMPEQTLRDWAVSHRWRMRGY